MTTLPANSTFLPVLDDLLSPDFRTATLPGQTPQTPAETPVSATGKGHQSFGENHTGPLTTKVGFTAARESSSQDPLEGKQMNGSLYSHGSSTAATVGNKKPHNNHHHHLHLHTTHRHNAASKIQKWWKSRNARVRVEQNGVDIKAERAKHAIRHSRTEDHVKFLETEVHRLKSALVAERKLRSLQLEAIRSLWSQVQKVSNMSSTGRDNIMTQSMPNGLPDEKEDNDKKGNSAGCMSMSLHGGLVDRTGNNPLGTVREVSESSPALCECTKEIKNLRESLTGEMAQLRNMIDQLKLGNGNGNSIGTESEKSAADDSSRVSQVKRPLTLNLAGMGGKEASSEKETTAEGSEEKKEIAGYANQMASSILEGAVEKEEPVNDTEKDKNDNSNNKA